MCSSVGQNLGTAQDPLAPKDAAVCTRFKLPLPLLELAAGRPGWRDGKRRRCRVALEQMQLGLDQRLPPLHTQPLTEQQLVLRLDEAFG